MTDENHYVTREEYADLLATARRRKSGGGFVRFLGELFQMLMFAAAIVGVYFLLVLFVGSPAALPAQSAPPPTPGYMPAQERPIGQTTYGGGSLPPCSSVADTRTACQPDEQPVVAPIEQLPTEAPAPTPTPAYLISCVSGPGDPPCWAPDAPPALALPETPIVLLPETPAPAFVFADAACASWHPPLALPEGCGDE